MLDSHCHLDFPEFDADRAELVADARGLGIDGFLVPGVHEGLWPAQDALSGQSGIHLAVGLHPWWLPGGNSVEVAMARLEERARRIRPVAIGECGLDAKRPGLDLALQCTWLEAQLELSRSLELPVILHQVGARSELLHSIERVGPLRRGGVVHAFSGDVSWARTLVTRGFYLGFGPAVSAPQRGRLREALATTPSERLLLETDAPAASRPGQRSVPADLVSVCAKVAEIRATSTADLAQQCDANLRRLLDR